MALCFEPWFYSPTSLAICIHTADGRQRTWWGLAQSWYAMSFWNIFHRSGPNTVPWGQPRVIVFHSLVWPFIFTLLNILSKKDRVKSNEQLPKPQASSFFMVSAGHKESNALLISVDKMVTSSFLSTACFHSSTRVSRVTSRLYFFL